MFLFGNSIPQSKVQHVFHFHSIVHPQLQLLHLHVRSRLPAHGWHHHQRQILPLRQYRMHASFRLLLRNSTSTCNKRPPVDCSVTDGAAANAVECKCGDSDCSRLTGLYCVSSDSSCSAGNPCQIDDGSLPNAKDCKCGDAICVASTGLLCIASISQCSNTCGAGKYRDADTSPSCDVCQGGKYRPLSSDASNACKLCDPGTYNDDTTQTHADRHLDCTSCPDDLGSRAGAVNCRVLLPSCQSDNTNSEISPVDKCTCGSSDTECTAITGLLCNVETSTCKCPAGQYKNIATQKCQDCTAGKSSAQVGQNDASACQLCETGLYVDKTGATACSTCTAGRGYKNASSCETCRGGEYQSLGTVADVQCSKCPSGFYNADQGLKRFPEKHVSCDPCPNGLISEQGATYCVGCPIGWSTTMNPLTPCARCPSGKKGVQDDQTNACKACSPGQYQENEEQPFCVRDFFFFLARCSDRICKHTHLTLFTSNPLYKIGPMHPRRVSEPRRETIVQTMLDQHN